MTQKVIMRVTLRKSFPLVIAPKKSNTSYMATQNVALRRILVLFEAMLSKLCIILRLSRDQTYKLFFSLYILLAIHHSLRHW